jgi:hypothetical protein
MRPRRKPAPNQPNPLSRQQREHRRRFAMGGETVCAMCGEAAPEALRQVPAGLFEKHHVLGRQHDSEIEVTVCASCHAKLSAGQVDDRIPLTAATTSLERQHAMLGALGSFLRVLGESLIAWGQRGERIVGGLDQNYSGWRGHPWAK